MRLDGHGAGPSLSSHPPASQVPPVQVFKVPQATRVSGKEEKQRLLEAQGEEKGRLTDGDSLPSGRLCSQVWEVTPKPKQGCKTLLPQGRKSRLNES